MTADGDINLDFLFSDFKNRQEQLQKITRFDSYQIVFYRPDLLIHSKKVCWLVSELLPYAQAAFGDSLDRNKAKIMALVHDDHEIIMGDFEFGHKQKLSAEQKIELNQRERLAIAKVAELFPEMIADYNYQKLLSDFLDLKGAEAQLVKFADKFDAFGEALHEAFGGNHTLFENVDSEYGRLPNPFESYTKLFSDFASRYPSAEKLIKQNHPIFQPLEIIDYKSIAEKSKPHSKDSIKFDAGYFPYDFWKTTILKYANEDELSYLYKQKEFLPGNKDSDLS
ncbi:MAG: YfbR-like 5'-deoxynucleotidase [Patescibacteria group bacterium]